MFLMDISYSAAFMINHFPLIGYENIHKALMKNPLEWTLFN